jgi:hypothetical protein
MRVPMSVGKFLWLSLVFLIVFVMFILYTGVDTCSLQQPERFTIIQ